MNPGAPPVSIVMPVYNGSATVGEAIESALAQTFEDFELVVVDNASTDDTREIVTGFGDDRIRLLVNDRNHGFRFNHDRSVRESRGEYVKPLHADDLLEPTCVEKMHALMAAHPAMGLVFAPRRVLLEAPDDPGEQEWVRLFGRLHKHLDGLEEVNRGRDLVAQCLAADLVENWIGEPSAVMMRRSALERVGLFSSHVGATNDFDMALRLMALYDVGFIDEELSTYRRGTNTLNAQLIADEWLDQLWMIEALESDPQMRTNLPELGEARRRQYVNVARRLRHTLRNQPRELTVRASQLGRYARHRAKRAAGRTPAMATTLPPPPAPPPPDGGGAGS